MPTIAPLLLKKVLDLHFAPGECSESDVENLALELSSHHVSLIDFVERCERILPFINQLSSARRLTTSERLRLVLWLDGNKVTHGDAPLI